MSIMSDEEIAYYLDMPMPEGPLVGPFAEMERHKWYYAAFSQEIKELEAALAIAKSEEEKEQLEKELRMKRYMLRITTGSLKSAE